MKNDDHIIPPEVDIITFKEDEDRQRKISEVGGDDQSENDSKNELLIRDNNQPKRGTSVKNSADAGCGAKIDKSPPEGILMVSHIIFFSSKMKFMFLE